MRHHYSKTNDSTQLLSQLIQQQPQNMINKDSQLLLQSSDQFCKLEEKIKQLFGNNKDVYGRWIVSSFLQHLGITNIHPLHPKYWWKKYKKELIEESHSGSMTISQKHFQSTKGKNPKLYMSDVYFWAWIEWAFEEIKASKDWLKREVRREQVYEAIKFNTSSTAQTNYEPYTLRHSTSNPTKSDLDKQIEGYMQKKELLKLITGTTKATQSIISEVLEINSGIKKIYYHHKATNDDFKSITRAVTYYSLTDVLKAVNEAISQSQQCSDCYSIFPTLCNKRLVFRR